jgi:thioredoxin 1
MAQATAFTEPEPARAALDAMRGPLLLEFGTDWCGFCRAAQPLIAAAFTDFPDLAHIKVEDGSGRRLGRSFAVKLWPTLVFLRDGEELARLVRPQSEREIRAAMALIQTAPPLASS